MYVLQAVGLSSRLRVDMCWQPFLTLYCFCALRPRHGHVHSFASFTDLLCVHLCVSKCLAPFLTLPICLRLTRRVKIADAQALAIIANCCVFMCVCVCEHMSCIVLDLAGLLAIETPCEERIFTRTWV